MHKPESIEPPSSVPLRLIKDPVLRSTHSVAEFTAAVTRMYRDHFVLFMKLTVPAVAVSYLAYTVSRCESRELGRYLFRHGTDSRNLMILKLTLVNYAGHLIGGLASCASFAAICVAVRQIVRVVPVSVAECLVEIRRRVGLFFRLSFLFIVLFWLALMVSGLVVAGVYWLFGTKANLGIGLVQVIMYATLSLACLLISRFGLAMPAVMLDNYRVGPAMFRSDELTEGKWLTLGVLLLKSVAGGYIAAMLPFWIATLIWRYVQLPGWFLTLSSYLGVTLVEPFMFIGFALLYIRMSSIPSGEKTIMESAAAVFNSQ